MIRVSFLFLFVCSLTPLYPQTFDERAYQGYLLYEKALNDNNTDELKESGKVLELASDMPDVSVEIKQSLLWDASMIYAMARDTVGTLDALELCLQAGMTDFEKVNTRPVFDYLKKHPTWKNLGNSFREAEKRYVAKLKNPSLRKELLQMWAEDQRVRFLLREKVTELNDNWGAPQLGPFYKAVEYTDSLHYKRVQFIIDEGGWPKISEVGKDGSFAAWAIVQHSNIIAFQETCVNAMESLIKHVEVNPTDYANLVDRVRFNKKEKQIYGQAAKGYPIEDEVNLDNRRKEIGLMPMTVYAHLNGFEYSIKMK